MISNLRYEWRRITTVRATWILIGCSVLVAALLAEILALTIGALGDPQMQGFSGAASDGYALTQDKFPLELFVIGSAGSFVTLILLGVVSAQSFGQEYRHGTIRLTLTIFPRRGPVFAAKVIVTGVVIIAAYVAAMIATVLVALPNGRVVDVSIDGSFLAGIGRAVLFMLGFSLIVLAITLLTRILALGVIIPIVLALIVEPLLSALASYEWASIMIKALPFMSGSAFTQGQDLLRNGLVFFGWTVVLLAVSLVTFQKRDA